MAHYAKIDGNLVSEVIVAEQDFVDNLDGTWIQTSYNTRKGIHYQANSNITSSDQSQALRGNYAGVGYEYDNILDAFFIPKPFTSWVKNTSSFEYEAPIAYPSGDATGSYTGSYSWDEENTQWITSSLPNF